MKCDIRGTYISAIKRMTYGEFRRFTPAGDARRTDPAFGAPELRPPPAARTADSIRAAADLVRCARSHGVAEGSKHDPAKSTGVRDASPLLRLLYYNLIESLCLDYMHLVEGTMKHIVLVLLGERVPKEPQLRKQSKSGVPPDAKKHAEAVASWKQHAAQHTRWVLSKSQQQEADRRWAKLHAPSGLISHSRLPFQRSGSLKANDWQHLVEYVGAYLLVGILPDDQLELWRELCGILATMARRVISVAEIAALRQRTISFLVLFERRVPSTELAIVFHLLVHFADEIERWGPAKSYWMYFIERYGSQLL
jgi:hypothetical protein